MMEPQHLSMLSSLQGEVKPEDYIQPHYKESYRLAIDSLVCGGQNSYQEFLKTERIGSFLSEEELLFITTHAERPSCGSHPEDTDVPSDSKSSTGTYWPTHSDVETPDLELGWPKATHMRQQTNIDLLFHPPRQNNPTIKEVIRKHMQDARQVIAIAMDIFTDVDIFKEAVDASIRGIPVYVLLDDYHLQSFLSMAENHDIHIQKLKNMRVRTVKGQDYLCRSGAKFHGAMEQKFLLVDCQTVVYGSYSFMWSFEKINLSMVQVITGQLVESYDEEFRTLYARSTVPTGLSPPEGLSDEGKPNGIRVLAKYVSQSGPYFERKDQLRHTLDTVYRKTCERQMAMKNIEERSYKDELLENRPIIDQGPGALKWMQQYQSAETKDFVKRHSYAGEREDVPYIPHNARYRASNWNVSGEGHLHYTNGRSNYPIATENYSQGQPMNQMYRGQNMRQSYHGNDKQVLSMQQKMPSLEHTSKSFLRTWRLESYLNNSDTPVGDSSDYLDQYDDNKGSSFIPSRVRSSLVFNSTIPEQPETNSYQNNSSPSVHQNDFPAVPNNVPYYSPKQWEPTASNDHRLGNDEFQLKRRSLQMLDNPRSNIGFGPMRDSNHSVYASLGRAKGTDIKYSDNLQESWNKRHSVADPKSHTDYRDHREPSGQMYSAFVGRQVDRTSTRENTQNGGFGLNLNEDQRSISHYDVKKVADTKTPVVSSWQEPPSRTVSAAALDRNSRESTYKHHTSMSSPWFLKKSSKKIRSLLNIPEKKEASPHTRQSRSPELGSSTDTILAADEQQIRNFQGSTTNCIRHQSEPSRIHLADDIGKASSPRFITEELHQRSPTSTQLQNRTEPQVAYKNDSSSLASGSWRRNRGPDSRLYSRFEPFCALEKKHRQSEAHTGNTLSQEKPKTSLVIKGNRTGELHNPLSQTTHGTHENKLGKFIQRVGHFIHKNK